MIFGLENKITQSSNRQISGSQISCSQISELCQKHLASSGKVHHSLGVMLIENGDKKLKENYEADKTNFYIKILDEKSKAQIVETLIEMVLPARIELATSSLPMKCSTAELWQLF